MGTLLEVIAELAKAPISRDILERTRLGREVNNIRRQNKHEELNRRAKDLVREWRRVVADEERRSAGNTTAVPAADGGTSNGNSNGHVSHPSPPTAAATANNLRNSVGSTTVGLSAAARVLTDSVRSGEQPPPVKHGPYDGGGGNTSLTSSSAGKRRPHTAPVSPALTGNLPTKKEVPAVPVAFNRERLMGDAVVRQQPQGYVPLSPGPPRPGTAPASPALSRGRPSSGVSPSSSSGGRARHSAPNSPALVRHSQHPPLPSNFSLNGSSHPSSPGESSSSAVNASHPIHPAPMALSAGGTSATRLSTPSLRDPARAGNAFSRTNVANKRLRKGDETLTSDHHFSGEPPNKRQRLGGGVGEPSLPLTNGGIVEVVDDSNSLGGTSSGSSYCEVIDSFYTTVTDASRHSQQSSTIHKGHMQTTHHPRASNSTNSISDTTSNIQSKPRRGRPTSKSIPLSPSNLPTASDSSSLPGATRGTSNRTNLPDGSHCPGSVNVPFSAVDNSCSNSITPMRDLSNCNSLRGGSATGTPSSSRAGRGRGRRRSVALSPATSEIRLPTSKSKVKTTSQLVAELAERKGDTLLAQRASKLEEEQKSHDEMARNKIDHVYRYVRSLPSPPDPVTAFAASGRTGRSSAANSSVAPTPTPSPPPQHLSSRPTSPHNSDMPASATSDPPHLAGALGEEEDKPVSILDVLGITVDDTELDILSKLAPVDFESAAEAEEREALLDETTYGHTEDGGEALAASVLNPDAEEDNSSVEVPSAMVPLSAEAARSVERLHTDYSCGLRGTNDGDGVFREWHEMLSTPSYMQQPLHLLPYVILDF